VTSMNHTVHEDPVVPLAVGRRSCLWRNLACSALDSAGRDYQVLFTSWSATVVASAVLSGLAVSLLPECAVRPGMRILSAAEGFPALQPAQIGLMKRPGAPTALVNAICGHIAASLDNITPVGTDEKQMSAAPGSSARRDKRPRPDLAVTPAW